MRIMKALCGAALVGALLSWATPAQADSFGGTNVWPVSYAVHSLPTNAANATTGLGQRTGKPISVEKSLATNWTYRNSWETPKGTLTFGWVVPVQTNAFTFVTNLGEGYVLSAMSIGLTAVTNNSTDTVFTNVDCGLIKKIIPTRWP